MAGIYDFHVKDNKGNDVSLKEYEGKVLLIVNTATGCGFTPQYEGLENLYQKYKDQGFEILDFPCNQFGNQAPGNDEVNGENEDPLYTWLKKQKGGLLGSKIKWNFTKFLVDRSGNVVERFAPTDKPESIDAKVAALL